MNARATLFITLFHLKLARSEPVVLQTQGSFGRLGRDADGLLWTELFPVVRWFTLPRDRFDGSEEVVKNHMILSGNASGLAIEDHGDLT